MTVKEYAEYKGISIPAVYKQIRENRVKSEKRYGKILVAVREKLVIALTLLFTLIAFTVSAQKTIDSYKASNGVTYQAGDTVKLGRGSAPNGDFLYLQMGGFAASGGDADNIPRHYSGLNVIIKRVKMYTFKGAEKVWFVVGGGNIVNYNLYIEDAIATCEIALCKGQ